MFEENYSENFIREFFSGTDEQVSRVQKESRIRELTKGQRQIYQQLERNHPPKEIHGGLFDDLHRALDILNAMLVFRNLNLDHEWSSKRWVPKVRRQTQDLFGDKLEEFVYLGIKLAQKRKLDMNTVMLPFTSHPVNDRPAEAADRIGVILASILHERFLLEPGSRAWSIFLLTMLLDSQNATFTWGLVAEGVKKGDRLCLEVVRSLYMLFMLLTKAKPVFVPVSIYPHAQRKTISRNHLIASMRDKFEHAAEQAEIPVPDDLVDPCNRYFAEITRERFSAISRLKILGERFIARIDQVEIWLAEMWNQIKTDFHYGLSPDGSDWVKIEVPELRDLGYKRIQLIPGRSAAEAVARVRYYPLNSGMRLLAEWNLVPEPLFGKNLGLEHRMADMLLKCIAVHSFWMIVTGRQPCSHNSSGNGNGNGRYVIRKPIRPHFPRLPEGAKASKEAVERFLSMNYQFKLLPEGRTFRMARRESPIRVRIADTAPAVVYRSFDF